VSPVDLELVDLYAEANPGLSRAIIGAFIEAGKEPPTIQQVDERGLSGPDMAMVEDFKKKHDPFGANAENKSIDAELEGDA